ncbi:unnamed protein product [Cylicocyclus nassatus]|uniref:Alpha-1,3-glucosyltransferase n=1 Tax=Cylicocyclus nassatus TaxID=53992 RepID=A0AA36GZK4_CYLNA|nr:unnamed protein product [Cylicocyclus nassatus]
MMDGWSVHLNPKYAGVENEEPWRFHPYVNANKKDDDKTSTVPAVRDSSGIDWLFIFFILSLVATVQAILAVGSYSGEGKPPMFGDFEAQRHWMEITYHLPAREWYLNGTDNDLLYWGLDYPPLTAYHSYVMGFIAHIINPSWVSLHTSRGIQNAAHKMYMRVTAILPFYMIYVPAVLFFIFNEKSSEKLNVLLPVLLLYPGLLAIDNAHFQYNSISLGLFLLSFLLLVAQRRLLGSIAFVLALNYKQMELYHALPIFVFILARSLKRPIMPNLIESFISVAKVATIVLLSFALLWLPFILNGTQSALAVLGRIFPFYRGLYEDKVASVWCAFSPILRLNKHFSLDTQIKISAISVLLAVAPSLLLLFLRSTTKNFKLSLLISSLSFFLFSFQVHEKSILLAAVPAMLLLPHYPVISTWFLHISNTSMFSLCIKDGNSTLLTLFVAYYILCALIVKIPNKSLFFAWHLSCLGAIALCVAEWTISPPARYPHLFPLLNAAYSCSHFLAFLAYFYYEMIVGEYQVLARKAA